MMRIKIAEDEQIRRDDVEEDVEVRLEVAWTRRSRRDVDVEECERRRVREDGDGLQLRSGVVLSEGGDVDVDEGNGVMDEEGDPAAPTPGTVLDDVGESREGWWRNVIPKPGLLKAAHLDIVPFNKLREDLDRVSKAGTVPLSDNKRHLRRPRIGVNSPDEEKKEDEETRGREGRVPEES